MEDIDDVDDVALLKEKLRKAVEETKKAVEETKKANEKAILAEEEMRKANEKAKQLEEEIRVIKYKISKEQKSIIDQGLRDNNPEKWAKNSGTKFKDLIRYRGNAPEEVVEKIKEKWTTALYDKQTVMNKEGIQLLATFGTGGQGKTELCRQLVELLPKKLENFEGIKKTICLHISFNQNSPWSEDKEKDIYNAVWSRIILQFKPKLTAFDLQHNSPGTVSAMVNVIRKRACNIFKLNSNEIAVCLLFDETANIKPVELTSILLENITGLEQNSAIAGLPTFVFVTSLQAKFVADTVITWTHRPLLPILLPILEITERTEVADLILTKYREQIENTSSLMVKSKNLIIYKYLPKLRNWLLFAVFHVGNHFRALELLVDTLLKRLNLTDEKEIIKILNNVHVQLSDIPVVPYASEFQSKLYILAFNIFSGNMFGDYWVSETEVYELIQYYYGFVRERDLKNPDKIRAFVSLPALFQYWKESKDKSNFFRALYNLSSALKTDVLGVNAIPGSPNQNAAALEEGVMNLFYIRMHLLAEKSGGLCKIYLSDIFPNAHIPGNLYVWYDNNRDQDISAVVDGVEPAEVLKKMLTIDMNDGGSHPVFYKQGKVPAKLVEYIGPLVYSDDYSESPKTLLWTIKLREETCKQSSLNLVETMRKDKQLADNWQKYQIVTVTLQHFTPSMKKDIPKDTVCIGYEALNNIFSPFGASYLLSEINEKNEKHRSKIIKETPTVATVCDILRSFTSPFTDDRNLEIIKGKQLGIYFCENNTLSQEFSKQLVEYYDSFPKTVDGEATFQILFVGYGKTTVPHTSWFIINNNKTLKKQLRKLIKTRNCPSLLLFNSDGTLLAKDGCSFISSSTSLPWPRPKGNKPAKKSKKTG